MSDVENLPSGPRASHASRRDVLLAGAIAVGMEGAGAPPSAQARALEHDPVAAALPCCPIVELRQYTLHPGGRDPFIELFEREFIESQEAVGVAVIGQFRDLDDPDRFVWLRGFGGMPARAAALAAFYDGAHWRSLRDSANALINDSDNVLLLHPAGPTGGFAATRLHRPSAGEGAPHAGVVLASIHYLDADAAPAFSDFFDTKMKPGLESAGISVIAAFATETSENNFPRLPVRQNDRAFIWFSSFANVAACDRHIDTMRQRQTWREGASDLVLHQLARKPEFLRLAPTSRSAFRR